MNEISIPSQNIGLALAVNARQLAATKAKANRINSIADSSLILMTNATEFMHRQRLTSIIENKNISTSYSDSIEDGDFVVISWYRSTFNAEYSTPTHYSAFVANNSETAAQGFREWKLSDKILPGHENMDRYEAYVWINDGAAEVLTVVDQYKYRHITELACHLTTQY